MAYAAYREHPGFLRSHAGAGVAAATSFHVLDVTVTCADALRVRRAVAGCRDAGVVRCEPLPHAWNSQESDAPCVRLMIRLPLVRYAEVLHCLVECVPSGEIGRLVSWREHIARCGQHHGR